MISPQNLHSMGIILYGVLVQAKLSTSKVINLGKMSEHHSLFVQVALVKGVYYKGVR